MSEVIDTTKRERVHAWFSLTYANYLVLPRSILQSLPPELQDEFELSDPSGQWVHLTAPEDAEIDALCRRVGYGAVIDSAARQWRRSDPVGAFTKGACVATVQAAIRQAQDALSAPAAEPEVMP